jgi:predicted anti-sigma-YlaC factor YlaD
VWSDLPGMDCEQVREALSARIDGEDPPAGTGRVDHHLQACPACAGWAARAQDVTRALRLQTVAVPDLTASVLAAVATDPHRRNDRRRRSRRTVLRIAVATAAAVQLALALPLLFGADLHVAREIAVFEVALAVGFGFAAWRPRWARAFVPMAVVLAAGLAATTVVDVVGAAASPWHETAHLAAVMQAGLLWALARTTPPARLPGAVALPA